MNTTKPCHSLRNSVNFMQSFNKSECFSFSQLKELILLCCEDVDSSYSLSVALCLRYEDYDQLILLDISPLSYLDPVSYLKDAQVQGLIKKYPSWKVSLNPRIEAMKTFIACEKQCALTNSRFLSKDPSNRSLAVNGILFHTQKKIQSILGEAPPVSGLKFEFGPGAVYSIKHNTASLDKLAGTLDVTKDAHAIAEEFLRSCPGWRPNEDVPFEELFIGPPRRREFSYVLGDRLAFVPKTAKTDRPIAIGPLLNVLIQKGIGSALRERLKTCYNLNNRQDYHRSVVASASLDESISTIDLKSASDTIAYAVILDLFPADWFKLLDSVRSPMYTIEGKRYTYQKFSAMGNGYTFELETILFYALACGVCTHLGIDQTRVSVFGDDIIVPKAAYDTLVECLSELGFSINSDKSFRDGPFRESCGADYYNGVDVRPFFLKDELSYRTLFLFHNFLVRKGTQFYFKSAYRFVRSLLGKDVIQYFRTWNKDDDGALLDLSMPLSSYNSIISSIVGRRRNPHSRSYGVSACLYKLSLSDKQSEANIDWRTTKTRLTRVRYRPYRFLHI